MFKINLFLNIIIIIAIFILDGITSNLLGIFGVIFVLLLPKIRGFLFNKSINSSKMYEMLEFLLNSYSLFVVARALFDSSINFNNFQVFTYSYIIIRLIVIILILILTNLIMMKNTKGEKIVINNVGFKYIILFISIFSSYFSLKYQTYFNTIISAVLCCLNIYFSCKLTCKLKNDINELHYYIIITVLSILLGNEMMILIIMNFVFTVYYKDKQLFYKK